ncbi:hypothetical protein SAMN02746098_04324 [Desulfosporosinus lacus DSM 15449]|uniref:Uncharacterized protein n=1 Tax=Desulfosporosinus lacus DSM 15449 TaxID=1121420 RepID=A0A1M6C9Q8_9FIRM|nr:hypothetical protein SAMN02746098_04324 [Desulfosporosinus lacus DSM 15449]
MGDYALRSLKHPSKHNLYYYNLYIKIVKLFLPGFYLGIVPSTPSTNQSNESISLSDIT